MTDRMTTENIIRRRMHGLYLSRRCDDLETLAHELLGLHSWFCRDVPFYEKRIESAASQWVESIIWRTRGAI